MRNYLQIIIGSTHCEGVKTDQFTTAYHAFLVAPGVKVSPGVVIAWPSLCMGFVTTLGLPT